MTSDATSIRAAMNPKDWGLLLGLSLLWGGSFFFIAVALRELPPFTIVLWRVALAALLLWAILLLLHRGRRLPGRVWFAFLVMGAINNALPFSLIVWGQTQIESGLASILNATTPLFTILVAGALLADERLTPARMLGVLIGLGGAVLVIGPTALSGLAGQSLAQLALLGAALCYSCGAVYGRRFRDWGIDPLLVAAGQASMSALILLPVAVWVDRPWTLAMPGAGVWAAMIGLAVLSTALAYVLYFRILASAGATNLLLVTFLIPVSTILLGWLFLDELLAPNHFLGMAVIGLGLAIIDGRPWRRLRMLGKAKA